MALGADDIQASEGFDLLICLPVLRLDFLHRFLQRLRIGIGSYLLQCKMKRGASQLDIRTASCHIRRDRNSALCASLADYISLTGMVLRIQDLMPDAFLREKGGEALALLDRRRADEYRLAR